MTMSGMVRPAEVEALARQGAKGIAQRALALGAQWVAEGKDDGRWAANMMVGREWREALRAERAMSWGAIDCVCAGELVCGLSFEIQKTKPPITNLPCVPSLHGVPLHSLSP